MSKKFEVTVWGATGFTGRLVALYLAKNYPTLTWSIAGRSSGKLTDILSEIKKAFPESKVPVIQVGDAKDETSVTDIVSSTKVVIACAGPFNQMGEPVVAACAKLGTHYVDISGETWWHREMIEKYDEVAKKSGSTLVIHSGFDSIPSDLGTFFHVSHVQQEYKEDPKEVKALAFLKGEFSGGTMQTVLSAFDKPGQAAKAAARYGLSPIVPEPLKGTWKDEMLDTAAQIPSYESALGKWSTLWLMYPCNTRVVYRSHALKFAKDGKGYGRDFKYVEKMGTRNIFEAIGIFFGIVMVLLLAQLSFTRNILRKLARGSGEGPTAEVRAKSFFRHEFVSYTSTGKLVRTRVSGGDPGYDETAKMVTESALCFALDKVKTAPGFLTPATAFGDALVGRLNKAGIKFEVVKS